MIIDDDPLSLKSLKNAMQLNGYPVDAFTDPAEAWARFDAKAYDLVMTDIMMHPLDGIELLRLIRQKSSRTRVIVFTGHHLESVRNNALLTGADYYYTKPIPIEEIIGIVHDTRRLSEQNP
ncbi:MAG: response regulator, partial [FCB group bacterium]|nr:response regulator [FCB group bacterium]